jgi:plasmid stability protein
LGQVIIRNIDDRVIGRLKARAAAQRKSLEQSLRDLLTEAAKPNRAELLADLERIRAMTPPPKPGATYPTAEELIREDRDTR